MSHCARPSLDQMYSMLEFMEEHRQLALGKMKGLEGRVESKKLWMKLTNTLNTLDGPTRPMKSWIKFWSDKKSNVKMKVQSAGGDSCTLTSNLEKKLWDLCLSNEAKSTKTKKKKVKDKTTFNVKVEDPFTTQNTFFSEGFEEDNIDINFVEPPVVSVEDRHMTIMDTLVKVMGEQAAALTQTAQAAAAGAAAVARLADASLAQARALDRLATSFEHAVHDVTAHDVTAQHVTAHDVSGVDADVDGTLKRFYSTAT